MHKKFPQFKWGGGRFYPEGGGGRQKIRTMIFPFCSPPPPPIIDDQSMLGLGMFYGRNFINRKLSSMVFCSGKRQMTGDQNILDFYETVKIKESIYLHE